MRLCKCGGKMVVVGGGKEKTYRRRTYQCKSCGERLAVKFPLDTPVLKAPPYNPKVRQRIEDMKMQRELDKL